jgi:hypothetical protein
VVVVVTGEPLEVLACPDDASDTVMMNGIP